MSNIIINVEDWASVISSIATAGSLIAISIQAYIANKQAKESIRQTTLTTQNLEIAKDSYKIANESYRVANERLESEKAIQLAELYCREILPMMNYVDNIFESIGIRELLNRKIPLTMMEIFDKAELDSIIDEESQREIEDHLQKITKVEIYDARRKAGKVDLEEFKSHRFIRETHKKIKEFREDHGGESLREYIEELYILLGITEEEFKEKLEHDEYYAEMYLTDFNNSVNELLNKLEFFCMYFNTGVANQEVVYQSLHQSFLSTVQLLYFFIAKKNIYSIDKYYINIILLYNEWSNIQQQHKQEIQQKLADVKRGKEMVPKKIRKE